MGCMKGLFKGREEAGRQAIASAVRQKYLSSFVDTMKLGEQRELGELGELLAVQLFLPGCTSSRRQKAEGRRQKVRKLVQ